jgi:hypothetical protein
LQLRFDRTKLVQVVQDYDSVATRPRPPRSRCEEPVERLLDGSNSGLVRHKLAARIIDDIEKVLGSKHVSKELGTL